jgi:hypothetical protein
MLHKWNCIVNSFRSGYSKLKKRMANTEKAMLNFAVDADLLKSIDDFRFENRFATRVEAIRWLIQAALDKKLKPAKGTSKGD